MTVLVAMGGVAKCLDEVLSAGRASGRGSSCYDLSGTLKLAAKWYAIVKT